MWCFFKSLIADLAAFVVISDFVVAAVSLHLEIRQGIARVAWYSLTIEVVHFIVSIISKRRVLGITRGSILPSLIYQVAAVVLESYFVVATVSLNFEIIDEASRAAVSRMPVHMGKFAITIRTEGGRFWLNFTGWSILELATLVLVSHVASTSLQMEIW